VKHAAIGFRPRPETRTRLRTALIHPSAV
jgi:hypothetical protein